LEQFLQQRATGSYEEWIAELHPENVRHNGEQTFDQRFYIEESDHLRQWNARVEMARHVPARTTVDVASEKCGEADEENPGELEQLGATLQ
jgi:hypothetical protein